MGGEEQVRNGYGENMPALFRKVGQLAGEEGREASREKNESNKIKPQGLQVSGCWPSG